MANRPAPYTQADIARAIKGAVSAGLQVREVIASADGVRLIIAGADDDTHRCDDQETEVRL